MLCIFTTFLGHKTMVTRLVRMFDRIPGIEPSYIMTTPEDSARYPAPWWKRASDPWHSQHIARGRAQESKLLDQPFDLLFVNAWELMVAFEDLARRAPAAAILDAVPVTYDRQLRERGRNNWKRKLSHAVHHRAFQRTVRHFNLFLPMGSDCRDSLIKDYGRSPDQCDFLTLAPQDLSAATVVERDYSKPLRLLFVGNDFERKGGDFLLRLYREKLSESCTLTIVSNDASLASTPLPAGVTHLPGLKFEQIQQVYRESHIFLFPTQKDFMPQVLAEALAFGLPCIANDIGGVRDLVHDGNTGFLMDRTAPLEDWAERIHRLSDPAAARTMSSSARKFATEHLSLEVFERLIADVTYRLQHAS